MLELIDLDQPLPGQRQFISCWLHREGNLTFIVDPGPESTARKLVDRLGELGITDLDFILLTHIHLDHAGGIATLARTFPSARIICHPKGAPHLVEPERLWEGSKAVLGEAALVYGKPGPVAADRIAPHEVAELRGIKVIFTPGHAPHHLSFLVGTTLFVGEAAGTYAKVSSGVYRRPATPPRFFLPEALASLDKLLALDPLPTQIAFGHYGLSTGRATEVLTEAKEIYSRWVKIAREVVESGEEDFQIMVELTHEKLLLADPHYAQFPDLDPDIQERELKFTTQALRGIFGYLRA